MLRHRFFVVAVCLAVSVLAGVVVSAGVFASSVIKLFFGGSDDYIRYRQLADRFGESDVIIIAIEDA